MSEAVLAGVPTPTSLETCFTLSLGTPTAMAAAARAVPDLNLLKLKLGGAGDDERMRAVRQARPDARIVADANEAWSVDMLKPFLMAAAEAEALRRGCRHMWLDTYSFQARPFYEQFGFEVFAQLDGPAPIYPRYFMKKVLS